MKKFISASLVLLISVLSTPALLAGETPLSLDSCISLALANNRKAIVAHNNIEAAVNMKREAFTKYFPEISAAGLAFWANHDILQYNLLDIIELGIIKNGKVAGVQAMQPVFTGGQIVNGNKLADVGAEVAKLRKEQTENELRLTTETMYWKLVTLEASRRTLEDAVMTLDSLENEVNAAVEAGIALRNDLLKVQIKRNSYLADMVDMDNGILLMKMLLSQYVGLGVDGNISICAEIPMAVPPFPQELYTSSQDALPFTPDYRLLTKNVEAKKLEKRMTIGSNLPSVAFGAGWYYHDLLDQNHNLGALQIAVDIPLTAWWGGAYAIKRKNAELANARIELQDLSDDLMIEMQDKWNNLTAAHRKMEIEAQGISQSSENLRLNKMYYEAGMATVTDFLEAQTEFRQANDRYINAYGTFRTARAAYLIATGR